MKKLALLITVLLVMTSIMTAGCGRVYSAPNPGPMPRPVPHAVDFKFENCNVCHVNDQLSATISHATFTNDTCSQAGCHGALVYTTPNTSPVARAIPHIVTAPLNNCVACHLPEKTGKIIPHAMYKDNTMCLTPACHVVKGAVPTPTTSAPPASTTTPIPTTPTTSKTGAGTGAGTGTANQTPTTPAGTTAVSTTPPVSTSGGGAPVLTKAALPLEIATHPAAYKDLCMMCHAAGVGVQQYPLPPTWPGTPKTPGTFTITPGSDADHTGRTTTADCVKAGCHKAPW